MTQLNYSLKKLGKTFKFQKEVSKTEKNHDEIYAEIGKIRKMNGLFMLKTIFSALFPVILVIVKLWKRLLVLVSKIVCH